MFVITQIIAFISLHSRKSVHRQHPLAVLPPEELEAERDQGQQDHDPVGEEGGLELGGAEGLGLGTLGALLGESGHLVHLVVAPLVHEAALV